MIKLPTIYFLPVFLVMIPGWLPTNAMAQASEGLGAAGGLDTSKSLQTSTALGASDKLGAVPPSPSSLAPRAPAAQRMEKDPDGVLRFEAPISPQRYVLAKKALAKSGTPSIFRSGVIGMLMATDRRINLKDPFVMEYSAYLVRGNDVYFTPIGMSAPIELNKEQISSFIAYPPKTVMDHAGRENIEWVRNWVKYAEKKRAQHLEARPYIDVLIKEAESYIKNAPEIDEKDFVGVPFTVEEPDLKPTEKPAGK